MNKTADRNEVQFTLENGSSGVSLYYVKNYYPTHEYGKRYIFSGQDILDRHLHKTQQYKTHLREYNDYEKLSNSVVHNIEKLESAKVELSKNEIVVINLQNFNKNKILLKDLADIVTSAICDRADFYAQRDQLKHLNCQSSIFNHSVNILACRLISCKVSFSSGQLTISNLKFIAPSKKEINEKIEHLNGSGYRGMLKSKAVFDAINDGKYELAYQLQDISTDKSEPYKVHSIGECMINGVLESQLTQDQLNAL